jgi:polyisoprenoid-binding protein YceI
MLLLIAVNLIFSVEYQVDTSKKNLVKFISDAPMEDIEGITDKIDGYLYREGQDLTEQSELYFEVDLNSLDTGIGLRNRHMRENYLETEKFPFTHFTGKITKADKIAENKYSVSVDGNMFIHGETRPLTVEGEIIETSEMLQIRTAFQVKLSDYKIKIPQLMFLKINENIKLELDFFLKKATDKK